jgi:hypothetical protein
MLTAEWPPAESTADLRQDFWAGGIDQVICFKQAGRIPHQSIMKSLKLMAQPCCRTSTLIELSCSDPPSGI